MLFAVLAIASACSPAAPTATSTPPLSATATTAPSSTPAPSATVTTAPSSTPVPSATATLPPTASPTPAVGWDKAEVTSVTNQLGGITVSFKIPAVNAAYILYLGGEKYSCQVDAKYPNELYCWGLAIPPAGVTLNMTFVDPTSGQTVYKGQTVITSINATGTKVIQPDTCAEAGVNQSCEMECRIDPNTKQPCIVASCFDACGLTYSIQTCSNSVPLESFSRCDAQTQAAMKKLYNIP